MGNRYHYSIFIFKGKLSNHQILDKITELKSLIRFYSIDERRFFQNWEFILSYPRAFNIRIDYLTYDNSDVTVLSGGDFESEDSFFYEVMFYFENIDYSKLDKDINLTVKQLGKYGFEFYVTFAINPKDLLLSLENFSSPFHISRTPLPQILQIFRKLHSQYFIDQIKLELNEYQSRLQTLLSKLKEVSLEDSDINLYNSLKFIGNNLLFDQTNNQKLPFETLEQEFILQVKNQMNYLSIDYPELLQHQFTWSNPLVLGTEFCNFLKDIFKTKSSGAYSFEELELLDHLINAIWHLMNNYQNSPILQQLEGLEELKKSNDPITMLKVLLPTILEALKENQPFKEPEPTTFDNIGKFLNYDIEKPLDINEITSSFSLLTDFLTSAISVYDFFMENVNNLIVSNCEKILDQNESLTNSFDFERLLKKSEINHQLYFMYSTPSSLLTNTNAITILCNLIPNTMLKLSDSENWFIPSMSSTKSSRFQGIMEIKMKPFSIKNNFWRVNSSLISYWNIPILLSVYPYYRMYNDEKYSLYLQAEIKELEKRRNNPFQYQVEYLNKMAELGLISKEKVEEYQNNFKTTMDMLSKRKIGEEDK